MLAARLRRHPLGNNEGLACCPSCRSLRLHHPEDQGAAKHVLPGQALQGLGDQPERQARHGAWRQQQLPAAGHRPGSEAAAGRWHCPCTAGTGGSTVLLPSVRGPAPRPPKCDHAHLLLPACAHPAPRSTNYFLVVGYPRFKQLRNTVDAKQTPPTTVAISVQGERTEGRPARRRARAAARACGRGVCLCNGGTLPGQAAKAWSPPRCRCPCQATPIPTSSLPPQSSSAWLARSNLPVGTMQFETASGCPLKTLRLLPPNTTDITKPATLYLIKTLP